MKARAIVRSNGDPSIRKGRKMKKVSLNEVNEVVEILVGWGFQSSEEGWASEPLDEDITGYDSDQVFAFIAGTYIDYLISKGEHDDWDYNLWYDALFYSELACEICPEWARDVDD